MPEKLYEYLFPEDLLEYFALVQIEERETGLHFYFEERNIPPTGYKAEELESKGFVNSVRIQDFPLRGRAVFLEVRRRRWRVKSDRKTISRDWKVVAAGTGLTTDFAAFLKGVLR